MPATVAAGIQSGVDCYAKLEGQLRADLNRPRIAHGAYLTYQRRSYVGAGEASEVRVIEHIEHLHAQLQSPFAGLFAERNILEQGEVKPFRRRPVDSAARTVAWRIRDA